MSLFSRLIHPPRPVSLAGWTDWHSHLLPGVDDGSPTLADSLGMLRHYEQAGIEEVWLTPHIMEDVPNSTADLRAAYESLCAAYTGPVRLRLASENMLDSLFAERLEWRDLLPLGGRGDMLLVETSYYSAPRDLGGLLRRICRAGYHPVMAHPERYLYAGGLGDYRAMKDSGALFQLNLLSMTGYYGKEAAEKSRKLLRAGMYDLSGSDTHRVAQAHRLTGLELPTGDADKLKELL